MPEGRGKRLGVFVGALALVVVGAAVAGFVVADTPPERSDATVEKEYFTSEELVEESNLRPKSGTIEFDEGPSRTVLISTNGDPSELEPVVDALVAHGHEVRIHGGGGTVPVGVPATIVGAQAGPTGTATAGGGLDAELADADALLIVGGSQFSEDDHEAIAAFADAGGPVALATDSASAMGRSNIDELTSRFGMAVGEGYLYNMHENDANYQRVYAEGTGGDLGAGVDRVVLDGATPIESHGANAAVTAAGETHYSTTRESGEYAAAVQNGNVVVIGDADIVRPFNYNRADNEQLLGNVLGVLTDGPEEPYTPAESTPPEATQPGSPPRPPASGSGAPTQTPSGEVAN